MFQSAIGEYLREHKLLPRLDAAVNYCLESNCPYPEAFIAEYLLSSRPGEAELRSVSLVPPASLQYDVVYKDRCRAFRRPVPAEAYGLLFSALQERVAESYLAEAGRTAGEAPPSPQRKQSPARAKSAGKQAKPDASKTGKGQAPGPVEVPENAQLSPSIPHSLAGRLAGLPIAIFASVSQLWPQLQSAVASLFSPVCVFGEDAGAGRGSSADGSPSRPANRPDSSKGTAKSSAKGSSAAPVAPVASEATSSSLPGGLVGISPEQLSSLQTLVFEHMFDIRCALRGSCELMELRSMLRPEAPQSITLPFPLVPLFALEDFAEIGLKAAPGLKPQPTSPLRSQLTVPADALRGAPPAYQVMRSFCQLVSRLVAFPAGAAAEQKGKKDQAGPARIVFPFECRRSQDSLALPGIPGIAEAFQLSPEDFEPKASELLAQEALQAYQQPSSSAPAPEAQEGRQAGDRKEKPAKAGERAQKDPKKGQLEAPTLCPAAAVLGLVRSLSRALSAADGLWQEYAQIYMKLDLGKLVSSLTTVLPDYQSKICDLQEELDKVYPNCRKSHPFYEQKLAFLESCQQNPPERSLERYLVNILAAAGGTSTLFVPGILDIPEENSVVEPRPVSSRPSSALGNGGGKAAKTKPAAQAKGAKAGEEPEEAYIPLALLQTYSRRLAASELLSSLSEYARLFVTLERIGLSVRHDVTVVAGSEEEQAVLLRGARRTPAGDESQAGASESALCQAILYSSEAVTPRHAVDPRFQALTALAALPALPGAPAVPAAGDALARSPRGAPLDSPASGTGRWPASRSRHSRASVDVRPPAEARPPPRPCVLLGLGLESTPEPEESQEDESRPPRSASRGSRAAADASKSPASQKAGKKADAEPAPTQNCFDPSETPESLLTRPRWAILCGHWGFKASCVAELEAYAQDALELSTEGRCALP